MDLRLLFIGLGLGLAVAVQPGPMSIWLLRSTLAGGIAVGAAIGAAIALVDTGYAALGATGASAVLAIDGIELVAGLVGAVALVGLGLLTLRAARSVSVDTPQAPAPTARLSSCVSPGDTQDESRAVVSPRRAFVISVGATLANPTTILSWAAAFTAIGASMSLDGAADVGTVVLGVGLGSSAWFAVLTCVAAVAGSRIGTRTLRVVDVVSGLALIAFGIVLAARVLA